MDSNQQISTPQLTYYIYSTSNNNKNALLGTKIRSNILDDVGDYSSRYCMELGQKACQYGNVGVGESAIQGMTRDRDLDNNTCIEVHVQEKSKNMHKKNSVKLPVMRIKIPTIYQIKNGQLPKNLFSSIGKNNDSEHISKQLKITSLDFNIYRTGQDIRWLLYCISQSQKHEVQNSFTQIPILCGTTNNNTLATLKPSRYFKNWYKYSKYFNYYYHQHLHTKQFMNHNNKPVIFGLYHIDSTVCNIESKLEEEFAVIDYLELRVYVLRGGEWVFGEFVKLVEMEDHQAKEEESIVNIAKKDTTLSKLPTQTPTQKWQSILDLQYKLKHHIRKLTHNYYLKPHTNNKYRSHYLIQFIVGNSQAYFIIVYNNQTIMEDVIGYGYGGDRILVEFGRLGRNNRLRYPEGYYGVLGELYRRVVAWTANRNTGELTKLSQSQIILLCKYMLIQNITNINQLQPQPQKPNLQPTRLTIPTILTLPYSTLSQNPITPTLILYWLVTPPGSNKTTTYNHLNRILQEYQVEILRIEENQLSLNLNGFQDRLKVFCRQWLEGQGRVNGREKERLGYCLLDGYFGVGRLEEVVACLGRVLPENVYYQLCLVTTEVGEAATFVSQINNCPNQTPRTITTSYHFSLDYILCCLLNIQTRPYNPTTPTNLYSQSTKSLSKILHYISSTYTNIDLHKTVANLDVYGGQVRIIQYPSQNNANIKWQYVDEEEKEQIVDELRMLLEMSYKKCIQEDVLLAYFLENVEELEYTFGVQGVADVVVERTFPQLPYWSSS